ncbi:hypothetical protein SPW_5933 [Streptomyces sp. W007]|nr:hypothetical protein SPW_5933 [Streptomyces sp. W007]
MPQLAPEQILRACDYVELVWQEQGSEEDKAAPAEFHADGPEPARLIGEFDLSLLRQLPLAGVTVVQRR